MFSLWINHGKKINNESYAYAILPNTNVDEVNKYELPVEVLSNNGYIQAVRHKQLGIDYMIFYQSGKINLRNNIEIFANCPSIIMLKENNGKIC